MNKTMTAVILSCLLSCSASAARALEPAARPPADYVRRQLEPLAADLESPEGEKALATVLVQLGLLPGAEALLERAAALEARRRAGPLAPAELQELARLLRDFSKPGADPLSRAEPAPREAEVRAVQGLLSQVLTLRGRPALDVDGVYGEVTRRAVGEFQASVSLPATGLVDGATARRLREEADFAAGFRAWRAAAPDPAGGFDVRLLQRQLRLVESDRRRPPLDADGVYGARTRRAVYDLQVEAGLPATGQVDSATARRLRDEAELAARLRAKRVGEAPTRIRRKMGKQPR
ncbi:MAG: peptidoglycan-binding protein [Elusimicrobia bacterium]|nr:peptidoglycan-binding protein [Elusimicrobiota bacterium]